MSCSAAGCATSNASQAAGDLQVGILVLKKQLDAQKLQGQALNQLLEQAVQQGRAPDRGQAFDANA